MHCAQPGLFDESTPFHHHLEYGLNDPERDLPAVITVAHTLSEATSQGEYLIIGIRPSVWAAFNPGQSPAACHDFDSIRGNTPYCAVSTQNDVWFWLQGHSQDRNLDTALRIHRQLGALGDLKVDVPTFVRHEKRDLTGFIDGSANPIATARQQAALIPDGQPGGGGSIALTQRWRHDLNAFNALSEEAQEKVIGRTKRDSIELQGDAQPVDSHVSRTDVTLEGTPLKIYRRSTPYGTVSEHGLYFVAFACQQRRLQIQLERMYGVWPDGLHDKIIEFSCAITSSYWFVPSLNTLADKAGSPTHF